MNIKFIDIKRYSISLLVLAFVQVSKTLQYFCLDNMHVYYNCILNFSITRATRTNRTQFKFQCKFVSVKRSIYILLSILFLTIRIFICKLNVQHQFNVVCLLIFTITVAGLILISNIVRTTECDASKRRSKSH